MSEKVRVEVEGKYDTNFCLIEGDKAELWGHNVSSHPWKDRSYPPILVDRITRHQAEEMARKYQENKKKVADEKAAKAAERLDRKELLASLAGIYGDLILNPYGEIEDDYGNYLFSLPYDIPADVVGWIKTKFNQFLEEEDYYV